ncbi:permease [Sulfolobales archaeon HS-7]|nr:permease [Sulfolobales archaeon HS-7]
MAIHNDKVRFLTYVTAPFAMELIRTGAVKKFPEILSSYGIEKVYIENYRDGLLLSKSDLQYLKDRFERRLEVSGGMAIGTWGEGWGEMEQYEFKVACISDERNRQMIKAVAERNAEVFNEVIIDDFWANWCYSEKDVEKFNEIYGYRLDKNTLSKLLADNDEEISSLWANYSSQLLEDVSKNYVVEPMKKINSNLKLILKVGEWRELYIHRGLNLRRLSRLFDKFYVGTESREFSPVTGSLYIVQFVRALVGEKVKGVWFDLYDGITWEEHASLHTLRNQAKLSMMGFTDEILLFDARHFMQNSSDKEIRGIVNEIRLMKSWRRRVTGEEKGLKKLAIQHPYNQVFDGYFADTLGLIGVPIVYASVDSVKEGDNVLLTEGDIKYVDILRLIEQGANLILTASAAEKLGNTLGEVGYQILGVDSRNPILHQFVNGYAFFSKGIGASRRHRVAPGFLAGPIFNTNDSANVMLWLYDGKLSYPVIFQNSYRTVKVSVLGITKYYGYLTFNYPELVRQVVRDIAFNNLDFSVEAIGHTLTNLVTVVRGNSVTFVNLNPFNIRFFVNLKENSYVELEKPSVGAKIVSEESLNNGKRVKVGVSAHGQALLKITTR